MVLLRSVQSACRGIHRARLTIPPPLRLPMPLRPPLRLYSSEVPSTSYAKAEDPVIRLASLSLDSGTTSGPTLESLDPSSAQYAQQAKTLSDQASLRSVWDTYKTLDVQLHSAIHLSHSDPDAEMRQLAAEEITTLQAELSTLRSTLSSNLFPADEIHSSGALIELRPGIGGEESGLFVAEMSRMYERWCAARHPQWRVSTLSATASEFPNALKEVILQIEGRNAYGQLRFEAGIHRVQRVPITTNSAKMQSSTITIVVLPLASESSSNSADELVDPKDVKTEVMRSRGAGGQHVNKTESAIRLTHTPTGITVSMQDSRSQHANREKAWAVLRSRLLDIKNKEKEEHERAIRGDQIGGLSRSDRVRTYNFPQDRVTDHRVQLNANNLDLFMEGTGEALSEFVEVLQERERQGLVEAKLRELQRLSAEDTSMDKKKGRR